MRLEGKELSWSMSPAFFGLSVSQNPYFVHMSKNLIKPLSRLTSYKFCWTTIQIQLFYLHTFL